jgi:hypothetical protein
MCRPNCLKLYRDIILNFVMWWVSSHFNWILCCGPGASHCCTDHIENSFYQVDPLFKNCYFLNIWLTSKFLCSWLICFGISFSSSSACDSTEQEVTIHSYLKSVSVSGHCFPFVITVYLEWRKTIHHNRNVLSRSQVLGWIAIFLWNCCAFFHIVQILHTSWCIRALWKVWVSEWFRQNWGTAFSVGVWFSFKGGPLVNSPISPVQNSHLLLGSQSLPVADFLQISRGRWK